MLQSSVFCARNLWTASTGPLIRNWGHASISLAAIQWGVFVVPTALNCSRNRWDLRDTFRLNPCASKWLTTGACLGVLAWLGVNTAISLKSGVPWWDVSAAAAVAAADPTAAGQLLFGSGGVPRDATDWLQLLAATAISPAVAEELLFRGFLLTALLQRLGTVDSVALSGALFAALHLSLEQFFPYCILGFAAGAAAVASGSVYPAVVLHLAYNATGLLIGAVLEGLVL